MITSTSLLLVVHRFFFHDNHCSYPHNRYYYPIIYHLPYSSYQVSGSSPLVILRVSDVCLQNGLHTVKGVVFIIMIDSLEMVLPLRLSEKNKYIPWRLSSMQQGLSIIKKLLKNR